MLGQDKKSQQAKIKNTRSRLELCSYLEKVSAQIENDYIKDGIERLKDVIEFFPPCSDDRALELDRKIQFIVDRFRTQSFQYNNYISERNEDTKLRAKMYEEGNKEIFNLILPVLENHLATRNRLMGDTNQSKKDLKQLSEYERNTYYNDMKELKNIEDRWNIDGTILEYTIKYRKLFYEQQVLQELHSRLLQKGKADKKNRDSIVEQLEQLDKEIEKNRINQTIIAREMANNKNLRGMMEDLNIEQFVSDNRYGQENFLKIYNKMAEKVKKLAGERTKSNVIIGEITKEYDEKRKSSGKSNVTRSSYYDAFEEHDLASTSEQLAEGVEAEIREGKKI